MNPPQPASAPDLPLRRDETRWFVDEVHRHDTLLKSWLKGTFPAVRDVDDVVQESYLRIWQARTVQPIRSAKAFLFRVARNLALDAVRRNAHSPLDAAPEAAAANVIDPAAHARDALVEKETLLHLADAIAALSAQERQVVILHKLQGLSQKEVAERLGVSVRTVEKQCLRGVRRCAKFMAERGFHRFFE